jgi:hypothetical protein
MIVYLISFLILSLVVLSADFIRRAPLPTGRKGVS